MSTTANAILLDVAGHRVPLDLDDETQLLPSFQANDRTKPDTIQSDYSPEFSVPATAKNHRLLGHAAANQPAVGAAYKRVPAVLTSGGVETLPLATLLIKGYAQGRYKLQLIGGNKRLVEALGDKTLADLDLSRFDHNWTPANILAGLSYAHWQAQGWGYEVYERGKPVDFANLDPYTLYPSCAADLVLRQIVADAGFTADSLLGEPLFAQLNVPSANPYVYPQDYRDARALKAGITVPYEPGVPNRLPGIAHQAEFAAEKLPFDYFRQKPYVGPTTGATYIGFTYTADTLGYYDLAITLPVRYGCRGEFPGEVSCKVLLYVNGQPVYDGQGQQIGADSHRITSADASDGGYLTRSFTPKLERYLLKPTDRVEAYWQGDEWKTLGIGPTDPIWQIGPSTGITTSQVAPTRALISQAQFVVTLLDEFPPGGLVKLNEWLPAMKQLDFVKAMMLAQGLTIQVDQYTPHLRFAPGWKLLANVSHAKDWTAKRDSCAVLGRPPERGLAYRFGNYGQLNKLLWKEDENVLTGYGDGSLAVADEVLPAEYEMATLPFAATENSKQVPTLLRILNFDTDDASASPVKYSSVKAQPRLTLRPPGPDIAGQLIMMAATDTTAAVLAGFTTTASYFDSADLSLVLDKTVLTYYWQDLRAMLDESRYLTERYRLSPRDIAELDFSVPIWDGLLGDYFAVSQVSEYDARRPVEVKLCRLNAGHLGPPAVPPGGMREWYSAKWYKGEWY